MRIGILGGGLSAVSLAYFLQEHPRVTSIDVLEKEAAPGGLCRSYPFANLHYDVGPHIMFSKNKEVLDLMVGLLGDNVHKLRRSNKIFHDGRFVKYPFENELSALAAEDRDWCLEAFLDNPYAPYPAGSMLQFFLATFGEGITNIYLRPYNEKIWKFDPAFMDTQMVDRIPKPPAEDIIRSAKGEASEGYLHQLHFFYPKRGGVQTLLNAFLAGLKDKVKIHVNAGIQRVVRAGGAWRVATADGATREYDRLVSTIPIPELVCRIEPPPPPAVAAAAQDLKFNSIAICMLHVRGDHLGDNFAVMVPDRDIIFHRLSKLDFLLPPEDADGGAPVCGSGSRIMAEVTYRASSPTARMSDAALLDRIVADLARLKFIDGPGDVLAREVLRQRYAYVIYDLNHRPNVQTVQKHCEDELGILLHGRFGEFNYINMDAVIERSMAKYKAIAASLDA
jgi:protoporphyrinogen oxidase